MPVRSQADLQPVHPPFRILPRCEAAMRALWDYLDSTIDEPRVAEIDAHLAQCGVCHANVAFERRLIHEIAAIRKPYDDPAALRSRILVTISRARATEL